MNSHLSMEEICRWLAGERAGELEERIRDCPACRAELEQFQNALAGFRGSLEQAPVPAMRLARRKHVLPRWVMAAAALSAIIAAPVYWNARQQAAERAKADQLLLERIDAGLSRSVPASMELLMQLVTKEEK